MRSVCQEREIIQGIVPYLVTILSMTDRKMHTKVTSESHTIFYHFGKDKVGIPV
jgi:hypothetical protein